MQELYKNSVRTCNLLYCNSDISCHVTFCYYNPTTDILVPYTKRSFQMMVGTLALYNNLIVMLVNTKHCDTLMRFQDISRDLKS